MTNEHHEDEVAAARGEVLDLIDHGHGDRYVNDVLDRFEAAIRAPEREAAYQRGFSDGVSDGRRIPNLALDVAEERIERLKAEVARLTAADALAEQMEVLA